MMSERGINTVVAGKASESYTALLQDQRASHVECCCMQGERVTAYVVAHARSESQSMLLQ